MIRTLNAEATICTFEVKIVVSNLMRVKPYSKLNFKHIDNESY